MDTSKFAHGVLLLTGVGLLCETCSAFETALEKTKLDAHDKHDIDIFIEQKLGYIHAKIDLAPTIKGMETLEKCIYRLDKGSTDPMGTVLAAGLRKRLERIESKILRVSGKRYLSKQKRSIEFIGNLVSDLFGNPGPADWKKNTANVIALQDAMKRLNDDSIATHSDIDLNRHNIELNNNEIRELSKTVTKNQVELLVISSEITSLKIYFEITHLADVIENQVNYLVEVKVDSQRGFCNDRAVDRDFLVDNLQLLEANKLGLSPIFSSWEWRDYYKYEMCSAAMDSDAVWITMRIPLVKKAEKLVRVIPFPALREVLTKIESYGLDVVLFREKNNDKFHVMTQSSLDFCTDLGKIKSCSVRDARFSVVSDMSIPVEYSLNRFLIVSSVPQQVKLMGRCPNGVQEHSLTTDAVLLVPVNCSYRGKTLTIDVRESDTSITKEIGIIHFDKLEIDTVKNLHLNITHRKVAEISNRTSKLNFEKNRKAIDDQLRAIDTKHDSLWGTYLIEKWVFAGALICLVTFLIAFKVMKCIKGKNTVVANFELEAMVNESAKIDSRTDSANKDRKDVNDERQRQQQLKQAQLNDSHQRGAVSGVEHVYTEVNDEKVSFGLPPESSQFYQKCPK